MMSNQLIHYMPSFLSTAYFETKTYRDHRNDFGSAQILANFLAHSPTPVVDRTGTFESPLRTKILDPISYTLNEVNSFDLCCNRRALEILALDCDVNVYWSGGIDATAALVALLKFDRSNQVVVKLNHESVNEYPLFYRKFILEKNVRHEFFNGYYTTDFDLNQINVTGLCGDKIFGSLERMYYYDRLFDPWEMIFYDYNRKENLEIYDPLLEELPELLEKSPTEIKTVKDCLFWLGYALMWQNAHTKWLAHQECENKAQFLNQIAFFNTSYFETWAVFNQDKFIGKDWPSYKMPAKEYIYKYTNDEDYRDYKLKVYSSAFCPRPVQYYATDSSFNQYMNEDMDKYILTHSLEIERFLP